MLETGLKAEIEVISATRGAGPHMLGGSRALDQYLHDKIAKVQSRVKEEQNDINLEQPSSQDSLEYVKEEILDIEWNFDDDL